MIDESGEGCRVNRHEDLTRSLTGNLFEHRLGRIPNDDDRGCDCYSHGARCRSHYRIGAYRFVAIVVSLVDFGQHHFDNENDEEYEL